MCPAFARERQAHSFEWAAFPCKPHKKGACTFLKMQFQENCMVSLTMRFPCGSQTHDRAVGRDVRGCHSF